MSRPLSLLVGRLAAASPAFAQPTVVAALLGGVGHSCSILAQDRGASASSACTVWRGYASSTPPLEETRQAWRPNQAAAAADIPQSSSAATGATATATTNSTNSASSSGSVPEMDEVFETLEEMGLQPGRNCIVGDGLALVDVGLYLQGIKVALQMEENRPSHTMTSDAKAYALSRTVRTVMQAHGWHMVTLAASDWRKLDKDQKPHYLAACVNQALGAEHGDKGGSGGGHSHQHSGSCGSGCGHKH